ncbi:MAG: hypothetical protein MMC33_006148 [Icmadophila ericetorum]|nr:hypothetical protein [Icmadophila ericetorum]
MGNLFSNASKASASEKPASDPPPTGIQKFSHYPQAQQTFKPPLIANDNAFLGDLWSSQTLAPSTPITCGIYRLAPGIPLEYTYTYHEMKIILDGDFTISDESGQKVDARKGDVFFFPKGAKIRFETVGGGLAFYTGQRMEGTA